MQIICPVIEQYFDLLFLVAVAFTLRKDILLIYSLFCVDVLIKKI